MERLVGDDPQYDHPVFVLTVVPVLLGGASRLFEDLGEARDRYECRELVSETTVAHARLPV